MRRLAPVALLFALLVLPAAALGVEKFAVVDLQKALNLSRAGREAKEMFAKRVESAQRIVDAKEQEFKKLRTEMGKQSALLSQEKRAERLRELQSRQRDFQRFVKDSREELGLEERRLTNKILADLEKVVKTIGEEDGYTFIFERFQSGILYVKDAVDLTQRIIKIYDSQRGK